LAHRVNFGTKAGDVDYERPIGWSFLTDGSGNYYKESLSDPHSLKLYLPQHKFAMKTMIALTDIILEKDPLAVIVIEADHGVHIYDDSLMYSSGYTEEDMRNLNFNVLSAVRIPKIYGHIAEPLDPLNISRWLVNNFVGRNYVYLPQENGGTY
jgi:hypothetical protein